MAKLNGYEIVGLMKKGKIINGTLLKSVTVCWIENITEDLDLSYSPSLVVECIKGLIYNLIPPEVGTRLITFGDSNLEKISSMYVKLITVTDEMRADDDLVDVKLPFIECASTDVGAMLLTEYITNKNWTIN